MFYVKQTSNRDGKVNTVTLLSSEHLDVCLNVFSILNESVSRYTKGEVCVVNRICNGNKTIYRSCFDFSDFSKVK